jgi:hypothetical protein
VEFHAPQADIEASLAQQAPLEVVFAEEPQYGFDTAMEIEPEIDADLCKVHPYIAVFRANDKLIDHLDLLSEWNIGGASNCDFNFPPINSLSPRTIMRGAFSFNTIGSPGHQSAGQILSPSSQFAILEIIDARPDFRLMTNLPYFKLQSMLEQPGVTTPLFASLSSRLTVAFRIRLSAETSCTG